MLILGLITGYFLQGQTRAERKQKFKHLKNLTLIHLTNFLSFRDIFVDRLAAHAMMKNTFYFVWFCRNWFATSHHNLLTFNAVYWHSQNWKQVQLKVKKPEISISKRAQFYKEKHIKIKNKRNLRRHVLARITDFRNLFQTNTDDLKLSVHEM